MRFSARWSAHSSHSKKIGSYNRSCREHAGALAEDSKGEFPADFVYAKSVRKVELLKKLDKAVNTAKPKQASAYQEFRLNLKDRWNTWELPQDIDLLVKNYMDIFGAEAND